ncbi:MAG: NAD(P)-dependent oxidoreductase [Bacillus sp. (in: Bacteria)]|nr:NAD(P)-dependent oxidoreductase [Bacillus sp. (in: firmicutes)]
MKKLFITGGTGYIGTAVTDVALKQGFHVHVITRSEESAKQLREKGAEPVIGDLMATGEWMKKIKEADYVIHLASPPTWGKKVTTKVAEEFKKGHYRMTHKVMDALLDNPPAKVVFVAGTSYYGDAGNEDPKREDEPNTPVGWGPYIAPSVNSLASYSQKGIPIVKAFPGQVYGPGSWYEQLFLQPLKNKKPITGLKGHDPYFSPIHYKDCARALVHLLEHGEPSESYFLVDHEPTPVSTFRKKTIVESGMKGRYREVPTWLCQVLLGPVLTEYATAHTNFSNEKLLSTGFEFHYPTFKHGIEDVIQTWLEKQEIHV